MPFLLLILDYIPAHVTLLPNTYEDSGLFFMRVQVMTTVPREELEKDLAELAETYTMTWSLDEVGRPLRTLIMVLFCALLGVANNPSKRIPANSVKIFLFIIIFILIFK